MTTPSNAPEYPAEGASPTAQAPQPTEALPAVPPETPPAEPFAPVARAPRTPWVNPARRGHMVAAAIVGALVFGGGGLLIGHAVTGHGNRGGGIVRFERGPGLGGPGFGRGPQRRDENGPRLKRPKASDAPTPAPSSTSTS